MPTMTILVGLPASGKSTWRSKNDDLKTYFFSTDDIIERVAKNEDKTYSDVFKKTIKTATKIANREFADALAAGKNVVIDRTNMTEAARAKYISAAKEYTVNCVCFAPPKTAEDWLELDKRLSNRPGKEIPAEVIQQMAKSYEKPKLAEGFNQITFLDIYGNWTSVLTAANNKKGRNK